MNSAKTFALGFLASLLYAAGFSKAAGHVDNLVQGSDGSAANRLLASVEPCAIPCVAPVTGNS